MGIWTSLLKDNIYRSSFFIIITTLVNSGSGFLFWMLAAKNYMIEDVGIATATFSSLGLIILFSRLGFNISIIRYYPIYDGAKVFNTIIIITTFSSALICIAYILYAGFLTSTLSYLQNPFLAFIFLSIGILDSIIVTTGSTFIAGRKLANYFYQNLFGCLRILFLIPLVHLGSIGILGSIAFSYLIASIYAIFILKNFIKFYNFKIDWLFVKKSLNFSFWNYISNNLSAAPALIFPIFIFIVLGGAEVAKYYIAFAIANIVLVIPNSLSTSLLVEGSYGSNLKKNGFKAVWATIFLLIPISLIIYIFAADLLSLIKEEYTTASELLRIFVLSSYFVALYSIFVSVQNVLMRVESIAKLNLIRFILLIGLGYFFLLRSGIIGIGFAWMITHLIMAIIIVYIALKEGWIDLSSIYVPR